MGAMCCQNVFSLNHGDRKFSSGDLELIIVLEAEIYIVSHASGTSCIKNFILSIASGVIYLPQKSASDEQICAWKSVMSKQTRYSWFTDIWYVGLITQISKAEEQ